MKYDLVISDYDKTLGGLPENNIDEEVLSAIKEYQNKGGKFVICTGRMFKSIRKICLNAGLKGLVVAFQGAMIRDIETGTPVLESGLDTDVAIEVEREFSKEPDTDVVVYLGDEFYYQKRSKYIDFYENLLNIEGVKVDSLADEIKKCDKFVSKICVLGEPSQVAEITERYNKIYKGNRVLFNNGADCLTEAINPMYHKGTAVKFLSLYYNIPFSHIMTVGDSTNDISLIDGEWHGVCVGDGKDELKKVAKEITLPYKEKPILHLLKKYCL